MDLSGLAQRAETQEGGGKMSSVGGTGPAAAGFEGEEGGHELRNSVAFTNWERPLAAGRRENGDLGFTSIRN